MFADNLFRRVALDALRARIPARNPSFRREHVDRIVGNTVHEQPELLFALPQRFFVLPPLSQVPGDLGIADQLAAGGSDGVDDDVRPEARPVLADTPPFAFELSGLVRNLEVARRQSQSAVAVVVEAREVLADNLPSLVAFEAPRSGVPTGHDTIDVQHVDRIIGDGFDKKAVAALF